MYTIEDDKVTHGRRLLGIDIASLDSLQKACDKLGKLLILSIDRRTTGHYFIVATPVEIKELV